MGLCLDDACMEVAHSYPDTPGRIQMLSTSDRGRLNVRHPKGDKKQWSQAKRQLNSSCGRYGPGSLQFGIWFPGNREISSYPPRLGRSSDGAHPKYRLYSRLNWEALSYQPSFSPAILCQGVTRTSERA